MAVNIIVSCIFIILLWRYKSKVLPTLRNTNTCFKRAAPAIAVCLFCTFSFVYKFYTRPEFDFHYSSEVVKTGEEVTVFSDETLDRWLLQRDFCTYIHLKHPLVLYNKVPKTGSSTVTSVLSTLSEKKPSISIHPHLLDSQVALRHLKHARLTKETPHKTTIIHGHFAFVNFSLFGPSKPVYINTFRDPLDRIISNYYYVRFNRVAGAYSKKDKLASFEDCVLKGTWDCVGDGVRSNQIRYYCGLDQFCGTATDRALNLAKHNVARYYMAVGPTEDLLGFFQLLEKLLPQVFRGALDIYRPDNSTKHLEKRASHDKTRYRLPPAHVVEIMKTKYLNHEYDFHKFLLQTYHTLKSRTSQLLCT